MMSSLKDRILRTESHSGSLIDELRELFLSLDADNSESVDIVPFLAKVFEDDNNFDIDMQLDVSSFLSQVVRKIVPLDPSLLEPFRGQLLNELYRKDYETTHFMRKSEIFYYLSINISGKKVLRDLNTSLADYVRECDVQFAWPTSSSSSSSEENISRQKEILPTMKRSRIASASNHLIFHLKRFEFDHSLRRIRKKNDRFELPSVLDLSPYMSEDHAHVTVMYELGGVIIHDGSASDGHYFSIVKDRKSQKWFRCSDESITEIDLMDIPSFAFGVEGDDSGVGRSALMVIYDLMRSI